MRRAALIAALIAGPAAAETVMIAETSVTLRPTDRAGALAEVAMVNDPSNGPWDEAERSLRLGELSVTFQFDFNAIGDKDRIEVSPPEGVICLPSCELTLPEGASGTIWLYDEHAVGM